MSSNLRLKGRRRSLAVTLHGLYGKRDAFKGVMALMLPGLRIGDGGDRCVLDLKI